MPQICKEDSLLENKIQAQARTNINQLLIKITTHQAIMQMYPTKMFMTATSTLMKTLLLLLLQLNTRNMIGMIRITNSHVLEPIIASNIITMSMNQTNTIDQNNLETSKNPKSLTSMTQEMIMGVL